MAEAINNELATQLEQDEQGFVERFRAVMSQLANEGNEFKLPLLFSDHVANPENNLGYVKSIIRQCTIVNVPEDEDGIELIKVKKV